jgi:hypothetical protein
MSETGQVLRNCPCPKPLLPSMAMQTGGGTLPPVTCQRTCRLGTGGNNQQLPMLASRLVPWPHWEDGGKLSRALGWWR